MADRQDTTGTGGAGDRLRLVALDEEDLLVLSAHLQDAVVKVGDMARLGAERRFALVLNRFCWERQAPRRLFRPSENERRRTGLAFERVEAVRIAGFDRRDAERVLSLLSISFQPGDPPSGAVLLHFSGDAMVRLEVEAIEARLDDLGPAWATPHRPTHRV